MRIFTPELIRDETRRMHEVALAMVEHAIGPEAEKPAVIAASCAAIIEGNEPSGRQ